MKTRTVQARLDDALANQLAQTCKTLRYSESDAIREALRLWLHNAKRRKAPATPLTNLGRAA